MNRDRLNIGDIVKIKEGEEEKWVKIKNLLENCDGAGVNFIYKPMVEDLEAELDLYSLGRTEDILYKYDDKERWLNEKIQHGDIYKKVGFITTYLRLVRIGRDKLFLVSLEEGNRWDEVIYSPELTRMDFLDELRENSSTITKNTSIEYLGRVNLREILEEWDKELPLKERWM